MGGGVRVFGILHLRPRYSFPLFFIFFFFLFLGDGLILDRKVIRGRLIQNNKATSIHGNILQNYLIWQNFGILLTLRFLFSGNEMVNFVFSCFIM